MGHISIIHEYFATTLIIFTADLELYAPRATSLLHATVARAQRPRLLRLPDERLLVRDLQRVVPGLPLDAVDAPPSLNIL